MIDQLDTEMIARLQLKGDSAVCRDSSRVSRALIVHGNGRLADLVNPGGRVELAQMDVLRMGNQEKIEYAVRTGKAGRVEGGLGRTGGSGAENQ